MDQRRRQRQLKHRFVAACAVVHGTAFIIGGKVMRHFALLCSMLVLACNTMTRSTRSEILALNQAGTVAPDKEKAAPDSIVEYLLSSAAADFHAHGPSGPLRFREVRIGHALTPDNEKQYRLCGQFMRTRQGTASPWMHFVTIKTSGYEQYISPQAANFCQDSSVIWEKGGDLSSSLQSRFDALR
jgi:hypothetical protein